MSRSIDENVVTAKSLKGDLDGKTNFAHALGDIANAMYDERGSRVTADEARGLIATLEGFAGTEKADGKLSPVEIIKGLNAWIAPDRYTSKEMTDRVSAAKAFYLDQLRQTLLEVEVEAILRDAGDPDACPAEESVPAQPVPIDIYTVADDQASQGGVMGPMPQILDEKGQAEVGSDESGDQILVIADDAQDGVQEIILDGGDDLSSEIEVVEVEDVAIADLGDVATADAKTMPGVVAILYDAGDVQDLDEDGLITVDEINSAIPTMSLNGLKALSTYANANPEAQVYLDMTALVIAKEVETQRVLDERLQVLDGQITQATQRENTLRRAYIRDARAVIANNNQMIKNNNRLKEIKTEIVINEIVVKESDKNQAELETYARSRDAVATR